MGERTCTYPDCGRSHKARGLCKSHAEQQSKGQPLRPVKVYGLTPDCTWPGCHRDAIAKALCSRHVQAVYEITSRYGITLQQYRALHDAQGGVCAICGGTNANEYRLSIDHDHSCCPGMGSCGRCIRGLLCGKCNLVLGHADDDASRLRLAANYLDNSKVRDVRRAS